MITYHVEVPELWYQTVRIEADSYAEALQAVIDGDGEYLDGQLEYSHTAESHMWTVKENGQICFAGHLEDL